MKSSSIVLVLLALVAGAVLWLLLGGGSPGPDLGGPVASDTATDEPSGPVDVVHGDVADTDASRRTAVASDPDLRSSATGDEPRPPLQLTGRVVDSAGAPVAGAQVALFVRRDPRALMEAGQRPGSFEGIRDAVRAETGAPPVTTDQDGRFVLDGRAFTAAILELAVTCPGFAPELVRQFWTLDDDRRTELADIVLEGGALVRGRVVGPNGTGVPGAVVELRSLRAFANIPGGPGGGRGGGNPFVRIMAQAASSDDPTNLLGATAEADPNGFFAVEHVPSGRLMVRAEAPRHVPGEVDDVEAVSGKELDLGDIALGAGAAVHGFVTDDAGRPIADAEVSAGASREAMGDAFRNARGRDVEVDVRTMFRRYRQTTRTDAEGAFTLDMVPAAALTVTATHPEYVDVTLEPVEPDPARPLQLAMKERPNLAGVVVDRHTGDPIELYGIRARRVGGEFDPANWGSGQRGGNRANQDPERQREFEARIAEWQARQEREQAYREQRLGGAGMVPGRTPDPTRHAGGRFVLEDLEPGEYVVDVDAPGYVRMAAGRFTLAADSASAEATVRLQRGTTVRGRVLDAGTGEPIVDARITLVLPPLDGVADEPQGGRGGGFFARRGGPRGREVVAAVRSADDGSYEFPPLLPGPYVLTIEAEDYPDQHDPAFNIQASPATQRSDFAIDPGARVYGMVLDLEQGARVRLQFLHLDSRERRTVEVDPATGAYEIVGLQSGGYLVQVQQRERGQNDWRARIGTEIAARSGAEPDVFVPQGGDVRYDVGAASLELGTVKGRVYHNGAPGDGLEVRLAAIDNGTSPDGEQRIRRGISRLLSANVGAEDGAFEITSVPPGQYSLEVHARGGGGGPRRAGPGFGNGALYSEPVVVGRGAPPVERVIEVVTGSFAMRVVDPDGQPIQRARVTIALAAEVRDGATEEEWRAAPSLQRFGVRDGAIEADFVPPGVYRFAVEARDFAPTGGDLTVMARSEKGAPLVVVLKPTPAEQAPDNGR